MKFWYKKVNFINYVSDTIHNKFLILQLLTLHCYALLFINKFSLSNVVKLNPLYQKGTSIAKCDRGNNSLRLSYNKRLAQFKKK